MTKRKEIFSFPWTWWQLLPTSWRGSHSAQHTGAGPPFLWGEERGDIASLPHDRTSLPTARHTPQHHRCVLGDRLSSHSRSQGSWGPCMTERQAPTCPGQRSGAQRAGWPIVLWENVYLRDHLGLRSWGPERMRGTADKSRPQFGLRRKWSQGESFRLLHALSLSSTPWVYRLCLGLFVVGAPWEQGLCPVLHWSLRA